METVPEVEELERLAQAASVPMGDALKRAGVAPSTYYRWREGLVDPLTTTLRRIRIAIDELASAA